MASLGETLGAIAGGGIFSKSLRKKAGNFLFGKKDKIKQASTLTPEQQELMQLINQGLIDKEGPLSELFGGFNKESFEEGVTKPALQNFKENILPQIQEKFISGNQVNGSGMRRAEMKAATDLQTQLAQLMYQAQQNSERNKLAGLQTSLGTRGFENIYQQGTTGALPGLIQGVGQGIGRAAGGSIAG